MSSPDHPFFPRFAGSDSCEQCEHHRTDHDARLEPADRTLDRIAELRALVRDDVDRTATLAFSVLRIDGARVDDPGDVYVERDNAVHAIEGFEAGGARGALVRHYVDRNLWHATLI